MTGTKELPPFNNVCIQIFYMDFKFSTTMGCLARGKSTSPLLLLCICRLLFNQATLNCWRIKLLARDSFPLALLTHHQDLPSYTLLVFYLEASLGEVLRPWGPQRRSETAQPHFLLQSLVLSQLLAQMSCSLPHGCSGSLG